MDSGEQAVALNFKVHLTVENVTKAIGKVPREKLWYKVFYISHSKGKEIEKHFSSDDECLKEAIDFWLAMCPSASWRFLIRRLDYCGLSTIADKIRHYAEPLTDPRMTLLNVSTCLEKVDTEKLGGCLQVPDLKKEEFHKKWPNNEDYRTALIKYFLATSPYASWSRLAGKLYYLEEDRALLDVKMYLKGRLVEPTLTLEHLTQLKVDVEYWDKLAIYLDFSLSKLDYITQHSTDVNRIHFLLEEYHSHHPTPLWRHFANALYWCNDYDALEVVLKQYLRVNPQHRFKAAMTKGHIKTRVASVLFHGPAGAGKTCSKCLIVGEDPPTIRQSTPVSARPVRMFRFDISDENWRNCSPQQRKNILAQAIKSESHPGQQEGSFTDSEAKAVSKSPNKFAKKPVRSSDTESVAASCTFHKLSSSDADSNSSTVPHLSIDEELLELVEECFTDDPIINIDMMHVIDTGGQPQCHEIMRHFVKRHTSLYIFVFKLSEGLDDRTMVAYYDNTGELICEPYLATQTNEHILQQCIRTLHSLKYDKKIKILFLGTHMDLESKCPETRKAKNEKLCKMVLPHFQDEVIYSNIAANELIFPINAFNPEKHEQIIAETVRRLISTKCISEEFDLPLQWYGLEILLEELAESLKRKVLHKSECLAASQKLHIDEASFSEAIDYLDEHNLIFYYHDILPGIIFSDVQVLLDKATELVKASFKVKNTSQIQSAIPCLRQGYWKKFCEYAIVTLEFLSEEQFQKHYVPGLFTPTELIKLFRSLLIFADFGNDEYFMPALLESITSTDLCLHRISPCTEVAPLVMIFPHGGPQLGVFCSLIVFLLSTENHYPVPWRLKLKLGCTSPECLKRNCIKLCIPKIPSTTISLIDSFQNFEVHVHITSPAVIRHMKSEICMEVCQAVFHGLSKVNNELQYSDVVPEMGFACNCPCQDHFHPAYLGCKDTLWTCSKNEDVCGELTSSQLIWLECFSKMKTSRGNVCQLDAILPSVDDRILALDDDNWHSVVIAMNPFVAKWCDVGQDLHVQALDTLEQEEPSYAMGQVLWKWLSGNTTKFEEKPTWRRLVEIAGKYNLCEAKKIATEHSLH